MSRPAQIALNRKLILERSIYKRIASLFKDIAVKGAGVFSDVRHYEYDIEIVLLDHYRLVFKEFGDDYRQSHNIIISDRNNSLLNSTADFAFRHQAMKQSRIITNTNVRQLNKIKNIARTQLPELIKVNPKLTQHQLVHDLYSAAMLRRVEAISIFETQWSAEYSKMHEVEFLRGKVSQTKAILNQNEKRWDAMGDDKMRDWHADADSQIVDIDEPFEVNGEHLMHPGDTSLGASLNNIINCRCTVSYDIGEPDLVDLTEHPELGDKIMMMRDTGKGGASDFNLEAAKEELAGQIDAMIENPNTSDALKEKLYQIRISANNALSQAGINKVKKKLTEMAPAKAFSAADAKEELFVRIQDLNELAEKIGNDTLRDEAYKLTFDVHKVTNKDDYNAVLKKIKKFEASYSHQPVGGLNKLTDSEATIARRIEETVEKYKDAVIHSTADDLPNKYENFEFGKFDGNQVIVMNQYKGGSSNINEAVRSKFFFSKDPSDTYTKNIVEQLTESIKKSRVASNTTVYRGISSFESELYGKVGDIVVAPNFQSTSLNLKVAQEFRRQHTGGKIIKISLPKGTNALPIDEALNNEGIQSSFHGEQEVVLPYGSRYKITGITHDGFELDYLGAELKIMQLISHTSNITAFTSKFISGKFLDRMVISLPELIATLLVSGREDEAKQIIQDFERGLINR